MNFCFNLDEISTIIAKAELGCITPNEHSFLQKVIAVQTVINQYSKNINEQALHFQKLIYKYYTFVCYNLERNSLNEKELTDLFLLKNSLEKFNYCEPKFNLGYDKPLSNFYLLLELAKIWKIEINDKFESKINFIKHLMHNFYGIPINLVEKIFELVLGNWKPILAPLGGIINKKYSLKEIEDYFFGENYRPGYKIQIIDKIDRFFSLVDSVHQNYVFLSKETDYDVFEAALVVHELQHILDAKQNTILPNTLSSEENLYLSEKSALNSERIFLIGNGSSKRGKYAWIESNLFYPLMLLKCELLTYKSNEQVTMNFKSVCLAHGMEAIGLSSLFDWGAPFQMSAYCAAAMELEQNWKKYIQ